MTIKNQALENVLEMINSGMPWEAVRSNPLAEEIYRVLLWQSGKYALFMILIAFVLSVIGYAIARKGLRANRSIAASFTLASMAITVLAGWFGLDTWNVYTNPLYYVQEYCTRVIVYG